MYAKTLGRAHRPAQVEAMAEAGYWAWSRTGPHIVWADLPDQKKEQWRMAARAVPATGMASPRELRNAQKDNILVSPWRDIPNPLRQRWMRVAEAMVRARDGANREESA